MNQLIKKSINVLKSLHGNHYVNEQLKNYGLNPMLFSHWTELEQNKYNSAVITHYGFRTAECLYRSHYLMTNKAAKYINQINRYLLSQELYPVAPNNPLVPYTIMISGKDSKLANKTITDKFNNKPVYQLYNQLHHQIVKKINKMPTITYLIGRTEDPFHLSNSNHIYSHAHKHGLIVTNSPLSIFELKQYIKHEFTKIFGYKPTHANIQQLYLFQNGIKIPAEYLNLKNKIKAIDTFIKYLCIDYKLQTKDTDDIFFNNSDSRLTHNQRSLAFHSQLNATKSLQTINKISTSKIKNNNNQAINSNLSIISEEQFNVIMPTLHLINTNAPRHKKSGFNSNNDSHSNIYSVKLRANHTIQQQQVENVGNVVINKRCSGIPP